MASFTFKLEGVLRQRTQIEQQCQRDMAQAQRKLLGLEADADAIIAVGRSSRVDLRARAGSLNASVLAAHGRFDKAMRTKLATMQRELAEARREVEQSRARLLTAATARKAIEKLRERAQAKFIASQRRRQQRTDEDLIARYV